MIKVQICLCTLNRSTSTNSINSNENTPLCYHRYLCTYLLWTTV